MIVGAALAVSLVQTTIPLGALGYPAGLALDGGATTLRVPVHAGLERVVLHFPLTARGSQAGAFVRAEVNGRDVGSIEGDRLRHATLDADVPVGAAAKSVDIVLLSRFPECGSAAPGEALIGAQGTVTFVQRAQNADRARAGLATYASAFTVLEPPQPDAAWQSSALVAAYALHVREDWRRVSVTLGATPAPDAVSVRDPRGIRLPPAVAAPQKLSMRDLGVMPLAQRGERLRVDIPFTLAQLGGAPQLLVAHLAVHASAPGRVVAFFNGRDVNEFPFDAGERAVRIPLPSAALRGANLLRLDVRFDRPSRFCEGSAPSLRVDPASTLQWSGHADIPSTLERALGELSGRVTVESDPAIFPHAFAVMNAIGSINRSIRELDTRALAASSPGPGAIIEIGAPPDIAPRDGASYGEVRIMAPDRILVSYVGNPAVLDRLVQLAPLLAGSNGTHFVFGTNGAPVNEGAPRPTREQTRQRIRVALYVIFGIVLVLATALVARRARRFS